MEEREGERDKERERQTDRQKQRDRESHNKISEVTHFYQMLLVTMAHCGDSLHEDVLFVYFSCYYKILCCVSNKLRKFISHSYGGWKPEIRVPAWSDLSEDPLPLCRLYSFAYSLQCHLIFLSPGCYYLQNFLPIFF
jgi:hypothetical protein